MSTRPSVLYPVIDHNVWAERYGVKETTVRCDGCGIMQVTDVPFACGTWRGLTTKDHGCPASTGYSSARDHTVPESEILWCAVRL